MRRVVTAVDRDEVVVEGLGRDVVRVGVREMNYGGGVHKANIWLTRREVRELAEAIWAALEETA